MPTVTATDTRSAAFERDPHVPTLIVAWHPDPSRIGVRRGLVDPTLVLARRGDALGPGTLDDDRLSGRHAEIRIARGRATLTDLGSRNGTWVDGLRIEEPVALREGAVIKLGRVLLVFRTAPAVWSQHRDGALRAIGPMVARLLEDVERVAPRDAPVLVRGATGTGKELIARALHQASGRGGPFLAINCAALDENLLQSELFGHERGAFSGAERGRTGLIEQADRGTLLLDEIGEASAALQASLLRVIQESEVRRVGSNRMVRVQTRFVAATHRDLAARAEAGAFREDLYARLAQFDLQLPTLAERPEDVPVIAEAIAAERSGRPVRLHHTLAHHLALQPWPRNVRELQATIERAVAADPGASTLKLPATPGPSAAASPSRPKSARPARPARPSREDLLAALSAAELNLKACAARYGVSRSTLYRWLDQHQIDIAALRGP